MRRKIVAFVLALGLAVIAVLAGVAAASSPATIVASAIPANGSPFASPGTFVNSSGLGNRVYVNQSRGFSLWTGGDVTYPACTGNSGRAWVVCGPHLHVAAANAPKRGHAGRGARRRVLRLWRPERRRVDRGLDQPEQVVSSLHAV